MINYDLFIFYSKVNVLILMLAHINPLIVHTIKKNKNQSTLVSNWKMKCNTKINVNKLKQISCCC